MKHVALAGADRLRRGDTACRPDPHRRFTVCPGTSTGSPASSDRHPRHIPVVLARLVGAAKDHVVDRAGRDAGAFDHGPDRDRRQVIGADLAQRAAVPARSGSARQR